MNIKLIENNTTSLVIRNMQIKTRRLVMCSLSSLYNFKYSKGVSYPVVLEVKENIGSLSSGRYTDEPVYNVCGQHLSKFKFRHLSFMVDFYF